jgi:hypothetical protein
VLNEAPSLRGKFGDDAWLDIVWSKACSIASNDAGLDLDVFPEVLPWKVEEVLSQEFCPAQGKNPASCVRADESYGNNGKQRSAVSIDAAA